jgi:hypothetical protein
MGWIMLHPLSYLWPLVVKIAASIFKSFFN